MLNRLLFRVTANRPCRLIYLHKGPYLERYFLGQWRGATFYLHRFVSSDSEEHIHNHPWKWGWSFILTGNYIEERLVDFCASITGSGCLTRKIKRRFINRVDGGTFHRICDAKPETWTLFIHGPRQKIIIDDEEQGLYGCVQKGWGFLQRHYIAVFHEVTIFRPYRFNTNPEWWYNAPLGKDSGRKNHVTQHP